MVDDGRSRKDISSTPHRKRQIFQGPVDRLKAAV
jgi:hypothetical protein